MSVKPCVPGPEGEGEGGQTLTYVRVKSNRETRIETLPRKQLLSPLNYPILFSVENPQLDVQRRPRLILESFPIFVLSLFRNFFFFSVNNENWWKKQKLFWGQQVRDSRVSLRKYSIFGFEGRIQRSSRMDTRSSNTSAQEFGRRVFVSWYTALTKVCEKRKRGQEDRLYALIPQCLYTRSS